MAALTRQTFALSHTFHCQTEDWTWSSSAHSGCHWVRFAFGTFALGFDSGSLGKEALWTRSHTGRPARRREISTARGGAEIDLYPQVLNTGEHGARG